MRILFSLLTLLFLTGLPVFTHAATHTVNLPITLDYPLLENLLTARAFPEKGTKTTLVDEWNSCFFLSLANPNISEANGTVRLEMEVSARAGTPISGRCFGAVQWQGYLVLYQQPFISKENWQLSFNTVDTKLLGPDRNPGKISTVLWNFIEPRVVNYLNSLTIDLMPPVADLKGFLLPLFPHQVQEKTRKMLASMRPGPITITAENIRVDILADVEEVFDPEAVTEKVQLSPDQLDEVIALWESWDSMLTFLVTILSREILTVEEQRILIDVLLETRHHFVDGLAEKDIDHDFVREQFVSAWQQLSPLFHNHLYKRAGAGNLLGYLAFVSSSDALLVFDRLGPTFGLEISRNGLLRMMQMLHGDPALLEYRHGTSPDLQKLFELNQQEETEQKEQNNQTLLDSLLHWIGPATATASELPSFTEILKWQVPKKNMEGYIDRIEDVLNTAILATMKKGKVPKSQQKMFQEMIPALAWQESCFRQFVIRKNKLTYLLSYNNSSVGLMQVNERVWRGIYRKDRLRWDIRYNSGAGCEIAAMYLKKYAMRHPEKVKPLSRPEMAGLVYAMYNGGPSQYKKYLKRLKKKDFYLSDKLFSEKLGYVLADDTDNLRKCLTGG